MRLHEEIRALRESKDISLRQLQLRGGPSFARTNKIELGKIPLSVKDAIRIAKALEVSDSVKKRWIREITEKISAAS